MQLVDESVTSHLSPRPEVEDWEQLRHWVECQPEPEHLVPRAQPSADLVQLGVGQMEVTKPAVVESLAVLTSPTKPAPNRGLTVAKDAHRRRDVEALGQGSDTNSG